MASWTQDTVIESPPEHSNIISPRDEYEVSHRLQTLEEKIGNILKKACQQKDLPIQEDERAPYPEKGDSESSTEMLKLLQSMETKLNCIETCLEKGPTGCPYTSNIWTPRGVVRHKTKSSAFNHREVCILDVYGHPEGPYCIYNLDKGRLLTTTPEQNEGVSDKFLYTVLGNVTDVDWKHLMRILGLTDPEMEGIKRRHLSDVKEQKYQMLQLIKQKKREKGEPVTKGEIQQALQILKLTDVLSCVEAGSHTSAPAILG